MDEAECEICGREFGRASGSRGRPALFCGDECRTIAKGLSIIRAAVRRKRESGGLSGAAAQRINRTLLKFADVAR